MKIEIDYKGKLKTKEDLSEQEKIDLYHEARNMENELDELDYSHFELKNKYE